MLFSNMVHNHITVVRIFTKWVIRGLFMGRTIVALDQFPKTLKELEGGIG